MRFKAIVEEGVDVEEEEDDDGIEGRKRERKAESNIAKSLM